MMKTFADVVLPLPLMNVYTYSIPEEQVGKVVVGARVIVPFGKKKIYTAIVWHIHHQQPQEYEVRSIFDVLDACPVLLDEQMKLWQWMSDYYLCTKGEVYKAALPSGMKLESESIVVYNEDYEDEPSLTGRERIVLDVLRNHREMTLQRLEKESKLKQILPLAKSLLDKGAVLIKEEVKCQYKAKTDVYVRLSAAYFTEEKLHQGLDSLRRATKQLAVLMRYLELSETFKVLETGDRNLLLEVSRKALLEKSQVSAAVLSALIERGILELYRKEIGRLGAVDDRNLSLLNPLTEVQQHAYDQLKQLFTTKDVCLLHGVTSSGKTEIYMHLIQDVLAQGKQVLYLLPEIVLTTQLTERLRKVFGSRLGIYHSKFSDAERVEVWQKQLSEHPFDLIVGVRSSVFLPFRNLGLILVDEEHEPTFKQQDPAPRYHARNVALVLAALSGAKTLLGTATPSFESYYLARTGKYGLVSLTTRYSDVALPEIEVIDIKDLQRKHRMTGPFSPRLLSEIRKALEAHEQVILFQNRRGFAPVVECHVCGWVPRCKNCDVSLTYHKGLSQLSCHYCGYTYPLPVRCPACESTDLIYRGFGTEKIEDTVRQLFPEARVARMDLDTTRSRSAYEQILGSFQAGQTDILIGTQMVTKGLDFERVRVVGILNADAMLSVPDFRSYERSFQMMAQVAGRAGRRNKRGLVILQTKSPDSEVISQVVHHDYLSHYLQQMEERRLFQYPPFCRLIYVYLKHRKEDVVKDLAQQMSLRLRQVFGSRILGPDVPPVGRVQLLYIRKIVVKIELSASLAKVREQLRAVQQAMMVHEEFRSAQIYFDVDPM